MEKANKRYKKQSINDGTFGVLDDDRITQIFKELSKIPAIILGDGIGRFEGDIKDIVYGQPGEVLYEKFNIRIIAVEKDLVELIKSFTQINPKLKIAVIDKEELLNFEKDYNSRYSSSGTHDSFIEEVVKHFKLDLKFSEKVELATIKKRSVYKDILGNGLIGCIEKMSYCVEDLKQKQDFYNEAQIKEAIEKKKG